MASFNLFRRLLGDSDRRERERVQARSGTRMLVVDDSPTIRAVLAKMLIQDGYTVLKAADGESALDVARQEQPDLVFLDIVLPGMNGFAVLRALRRDERTRDIPIVMISGNLQATEQFYVQRFGADDFMKKPFGRAEVFSRIQSLVQSGRLPKREDTSADTELATELDDMAHIPDVALPDEDLNEHRQMPASGPASGADGTPVSQQVESEPDASHDGPAAPVDQWAPNGEGVAPERAHQANNQTDSVPPVSEGQVLDDTQQPEEGGAPKTDLFDR